MDLKAMRKKLEEKRDAVTRAEGELKTLNARKDELKADLEKIGIKDFSELEAKEKELREELDKLFKKLEEVETEALGV